MIVYALTGWLRGDAVAGWTSLASITLVIGSVQLLVLGIMGEYLGRLHIESKHRPLFVVDKLCGRVEAPRSLREGAAASAHADPKISVSRAS